jgi:transposase-like protein
MVNTNPELKTLQEAIKYFADPERSRLYFVARRWPNGVTCPICGSDNVAWQPKYNRWQCNARHKSRQFTCKTGTVFEGSPLPLEKWMMATWMITNCKNGVSSYEIHRDVGVTQKSAWFMMHRIRLAMQEGIEGKLGGHVEVDETFIGGKARNMHKHKRAKVAKRGASGKAIVVGVLERGGKVRAQMVENRERAAVQAIIKEHVQPGSDLYTDEWSAYFGLSPEYAHQIINHADAYVDGKVHTNGLENFWSLLKRGLKGTYVSVEPFHLFRYLDEQMFRFNNRGKKDAPVHDGQRFDMVLANVVGRRVTYEELTGKVGETAAC